jgi:hypothetical protein
MIKKQEVGNDARSAGCTVTDRQLAERSELAARTTVLKEALRGFGHHIGDYPLVADALACTAEGDAVARNFLQTILNGIEGGFGTVNGAPTVGFSIQGYSTFRSGCDPLLSGTALSAEDKYVRSWNESVDKYLATDALRNRIQDSVNSFGGSATATACPTEDSAIAASGSGRTLSNARSAATQDARGEQEPAMRANMNGRWEDPNVF